MKKQALERGAEPSTRDLTTFILLLLLLSSSYLFPLAFLLRYATSHTHTHTLSLSLSLSTSLYNHTLHINTEKSATEKSVTEKSAIEKTDSLRLRATANACFRRYIVLAATPYLKRCLMETMPCC